ncbi:MAG: hypothetical protein ACUVRP_09480 [Chlorobiales bacterium]
MKKRTWFDAITREKKLPSKHARMLLYAVGFGLICAFTLTLFTGSYNGTCYGLIFGLIFGALFALLSRAIARQIGEGGLLWYGFAGILSGAISGALTKMICTPIANEVLTAVYGRLESPVQIAFYAVVCAAYLGGFFGLSQSLIFGKSISTQEIGYDASLKQDSAKSETQTAQLPEKNMKQLSDPIEANRNS